MKYRRNLIICILLLSIIGVIMIYSSSYVWAEFKYNDSLKYLKNQGLFLFIGLILLYIVSNIDYHIYLKKSNLILLICIISLLLVLIPGIGTVRNGSRSWFKLGPFSIQPSEATKLGLMIFTSKYLCNHNMKKFKNGVFPILFLTLLIFGIIMLQPDFGTGVVLVMTIMGLIFIGGANFKFFFKLGILGIVGITILILIAPYRLDRILSFLNPWSDPLGSGFQIIQSLYAIGPAGLFGYGFLNSRQKHFYLPEPQTDFIFSIINEEFGFLGCVVIVCLFLILIINGFRISKNTDDLFGKYLSFGIIFGLAFQALLNLMVVVGLIPVTGVTLPFLSYGGSSLLISMISMGIVINISKQNN